MGAVVLHREPVARRPHGRPRDGELAGDPPVVHGELDHDRLRHRRPGQHLEDDRVDRDGASVEAGAPGEVDADVARNTATGSSTTPVSTQRRRT